MSYLSFIAIQSVAMAITVFLLPRVTVTGISGPILMVLGITVVNAFLWDAALFFSLPDTLSAHSVIVLLANGFMFWLLAKLLPGIEIEGFLPAIVAPVLFSVTSVLAQRYATTVDWPHVAESVTGTVTSARDTLLRAEEAERSKQEKTKQEEGRASLGGGGDR